MIKVLKLNLALFLGLCLFQSQGYPQSSAQELSRSDVADSLAANGSDYIDLNQYEKAISLLTEAVAIYRELGNNPQSASTLNEIGFAYYSMGEYDQAMKFYKDALSLDIVDQDTSRMIGRYRNIGMACFENSQYLLALSNYYESLELAEVADNKRAIGSAHNSIASVYYAQSEYEKSLESYSQALEIWTHTADSIRLSLVFRNLGNCYFKLGGFKEAVKHYKGAILIATALSDPSGVAHIQIGIGAVYQQQLEFTKAKEAFISSHVNFRDANDQYGQAKALNALGELYLQMESPAQALDYLQRADTLIRSISNQRLLHENNALKSRTYAALGHYDKAYSYLSEWSATQDSFFNAERYAVLKRQAGYEQAEVAGNLQRSQAGLVQEQRRNRGLWIVIGGVALAACLLLYLLFRLRYQRQTIEHQKELINKQNWQLNHSAYNKLMILRAQVEEARLKLDGFPEEVLRALTAKLSLVARPHYEYYADHQTTLEVNIKEALKQDVTTLSDIFDLNPDRFVLEAESLILPMFVADHVRLIIEELMVNFTKYGANDDLMHIAVVTKGRRLELTVAQQGWSPQAEADSSGLQMIADLVKNVKGTILWSSENTSHTLINIPLK